jgi:alkyl hydroperoxide reductase subunit F
VPGIYAAGDVTTVPYKQIVIAMGEGAKVALSVFEDRMRAPTTVAVAAEKNLSAA